MSRYTTRRAELSRADLQAGLEPGWLVIECRPNGNTYEVETWDTRAQARGHARNLNAPASRP